MHSAISLSWGLVTAITKLLNTVAFGMDVCPAKYSEHRPRPTTNIAEYLPVSHFCVFRPRPYCFSIWTGQCEGVLPRQSFPKVNLDLDQRYSIEFKLP